MLTVVYFVFRFDTRCSLFYEEEKYTHVVLTVGLERKNMLKRCIVYVVTILTITVTYMNLIMTMNIILLIIQSVTFMES